MDRLRIDYPCPWDYQIIGSDEQRMRNAVALLVEGKYVLTLGNRSKKARYMSLHLTVEVQSEVERLRLFEALRKHDDITYVL